MLFRSAIFGDYDVDGATSSALLHRFLTAAGGKVRVYIPDRQREGYGPNAPALLRLKEEGAAVVVTVDCGITAHAPLQAAAEAGLEVVVIDHHVAEPKLPPAIAVVNPNRLDETSPHRQLAAVGVAFLLAAIAGFGLGGLFYSLTVRRLVPRIGEKGIVLLGGSLLGLGSFLVGAMPVWWLFIPSMIVYGMGYYTMHGTLQTRATELNPKARATTVSLFAFIFFLGQGIGPIVMGQTIKAFGYRWGYTAAGVAVLLLAIWAYGQFARLKAAAPVAVAPTPAAPAR